MSYLTDYGKTLLDKTLSEILEPLYKPFNLFWLFDFMPEHRRDEDYIRKLGKRKLVGFLDTLTEVGGQVNTNAYKVEHINNFIEMLVYLKVIDVSKLRELNPKLCDKCICLLRETTLSDNTKNLYVVHYEGKASIVAKNEFSSCFPKARSGCWEKKKGKNVKCVKVN